MVLKCGCLHCQDSHALNGVTEGGQRLCMLESQMSEKKRKAGRDLGVNLLSRDDCRCDSEAKER